MSDAQSGENTETLFSFELLVEYVRVDKDLSHVSDQLAVAVRLLDFPTLLIHQPTEHACGRRGEHTFNRGKSCFFLMNLKSLHTYLWNTPLFAMVLDLREDVPRLMGSSLVSLAEVMDRVLRDVAQGGVCASSAHGERGLFSMCSLTGEKIGSISLSYKLMSLGTSLLPHVEQRTRPASSGGHGGGHAQVDAGPNIPSAAAAAAAAAGAGKPHVEHKARSHQTHCESDSEGDLSHFCPPRLHYTNSARDKDEGCDRKLLTVDSKDLTSEDEKRKTPAPASPRRSITKAPRQQQSGKASQRVLGETLRQLPLLNALLVELSQLNSASPQQPVSVHPNLSWLDRPACAEAPPHAHRDSARRTPERRRPRAQLIHSPRDGCAQILGNACAPKQEGAVAGRKSPRPKLVYGTTKTFNLRLKLVRLNQHCGSKKAKPNPKQTNAAKGKTKKTNSGKRKSPLHERPGLNENITTVIERITVDTMRQKGQKRSAHAQQHVDNLNFSKEYSVSERRDLKCIQIPCVHSSSVAQTKGKRERHGLSLFEPDNIQSSASSGHSSPEPSASHSSGDGNAEADYADDFNSLELSEARSPDPASSPEASRAKSSSSPHHSDFRNIDTGAEPARQRRVLPVPGQALGSPQRSPRASDVIRPGTQASALSLSSDDEGGDGSLRTVCSRGRASEGSRAEGSPGAESGGVSESARDSGSVGGLSGESSVEPQGPGEEEDGDELGSLDLRKDYKHISELVANKLPGYTM